MNCVIFDSNIGYGTDKSCNSWSLYHYMVVYRLARKPEYTNIIVVLNYTVENSTKVVEIAVKSVKEWR